jgi:feruloyl esterase
VGNGGWAGSIPFGGLAEQIRRNNASASTNTGHEDRPGADMARFAFDHPEQLIDFAYRSNDAANFLAAIGTDRIQNSWAR